jgi:hypothetical protein
MKRIQTTVTEEYDSDGKLVRKITETVEEEDATGTIYPNIPYTPYYPITYPTTPWYQAPTVTCDTTGSGETPK